MEFYYADKQNIPIGPIAAAVLKSLHQNGTISSDTFVLAVGETDWKRYSEFFSDATAVPPPPPPTRQSTTDPVVQQPPNQTLMLSLVGCALLVVAHFLTVPKAATAADHFAHLVGLLLGYVLSVGFASLLLGALLAKDLVAGWSFNRCRYLTARYFGRLFVVLSALHIVYGIRYRFFVEPELSRLLDTLK